MSGPHVTIIGGGVIGCSIAYHLLIAGNARVTVIERDPSYAQASSALSASSIRQQFTTPDCIAMSRHGFDFFRNAGRLLAVDGDEPDIGLIEAGYLYLADEPGRRRLQRAMAIQLAQGVRLEGMSADELAERFGWLCVDDLAFGTLGLDREGWFDGYSVLQAFRRKARALGARFVQAEATGFDSTGGKVNAVRLADGAALATDVAVNAAGPRLATVAQWASFDLPVVPERRTIFAFRAEKPPTELPLVVDPTGLYVRPEGALFICGGPATPADDPLALDVEYHLFDEFVWPTLANRIPAFEAIKMTRAWAGHYEMNMFDGNALIGRLPGWDNLYVCGGFSGHGMQHAPAAGRGVAELIATSGYRTIDLGVFTPERIARGEPIVEQNII